MAERFARQARITVIEAETSVKVIDAYEDTSEKRGGLRVSFDVNRRLSFAADTATVRIWNLAPSSRGGLAQRSLAIPGYLRDPIRYMRVEAGYRDQVGAIFNGAVMRVRNIREGPDWVTEIEGNASYAQAAANTLQKSWGTKAGTSVRDIVEELLLKAGWRGVEFSDEAAADLSDKKVNSFSVRGSAWESVRRLLAGYRLVLTADVDGARVVRPGFPGKDSESLNVSEDTGLIGTPRLTDLGAEFRILLDARIRPGRRLTVASKTIQESLGDVSPEREFSCWEVKCKGDTHTSDWFSDVSAWFNPPLVNTSLPVAGPASIGG